MFRTDMMDIIGETGSGKTLLAVILGIGYYKQKLNCKIISNMKELKQNNFYANDINDVLKITLDKKQNYVFIADELSVFLDSRSSANKTNKEATHYFLQLRKLNINLIYTEQSFGMTDLRVRKNTKIFLFPEVKVFEDPKKDYMKIKIFRKLTDFQLMDTQRSFIIRNICQYYNEYNTREIIEK